MFWWLVAFPVGGMIIIIVIALLLGKRDRKRELQAIEENKKNLLKSNPRQGVYNYIDQNKKFYEYLFKDVPLSKTNVDVVYLSRKGLYIISVVGNEGVINGDVNSEYWVNKNVDEYVTKNPLYHNEKLVETLGNIVETKMDIYHVVICPNADITNLINNSDKVFSLVGFFNYINNFDDFYSDNDLMIFYNSLTNYLNRE